MTNLRAVPDTSPTQEQLVALQEEVARIRAKEQEVTK